MIIDQKIIYGTWDDMNYENFRLELIKMSEENYQRFSSKLLPNIPADRILGIRLPKLRGIAKEVLQGDYKEFLEQCISRHKAKQESNYFEETMLFGFVIAGMKTIEEIIEYTSLFLTQIDNWSVCDSFCASLKLVNKHREYCLEFIQRWLNSEEEYIVRVACVLLLNYYICDEYIDTVLELMCALRSTYYYVNMAIAWTISMCYISYREKTIEHLLSCDLDDFTYNKAIQKICESRQVTKEEKIQLQQWKRK